MLAGTRGLVAATLLAAGCGYVGEPQPPALRIPSQIVEFAALEQGDHITLRFTIPQLTTEGLPLRKLGVVEVDGTGDTIRFPVESPGRVERQIPALGLVGRELSLAVRVSSAAGRFSEWSHPVTLRVVAPVDTPVELRAEAVPAGVRLSWRMPHPRPEARFRVYRQGPGEQSASLAGRSQAPEWVDAEAVFGRAYEYQVQAAAPAGEAEAESALSPAVAITPVDTFPPAVPRGLTAVASPASIELTWDRNTEADLRGYRVSRAAEGGRTECIAELVETPAFSDRAIEAGRKYRYTVTSVDQRGNESAPSLVFEINAAQ